MQRRNLLKSLIAGAGSLSRVESYASIRSIQGLAQGKSSQDCSRPQSGPYAHRIPNVVVRSHEGQSALFYNDLVRGKTVLINCIATREKSASAITANLAKVQSLLGSRLGRDLFMYSITVDPEHDTPRVLKSFAEKYQTRPGWMFLTGEGPVIELLRRSLFISDGSHIHHESGAPPEDCSLALVRYGNEAVGLWGSVPAKSKPASIAMRLSWIESVATTTTTVRRAGPPKL